MLEGIIFATVFVAFFLLRAVAATIFFYYMLPDTDRCPCCDTPTLRVRSPGWNRLLPWFRTSWCYGCGWEGMLRPRNLTADPAHERHTPQPRQASAREAETSAIRERSSDLTRRPRHQPPP